MLRPRALASAGLLLLAVPLLAGCLGPAPAPASPPQDNEPVTPTHDAPPGKGNDTHTAPTAAFDWTPESPRVGEPVTFSDRSTDPDSDIGGRIWQFGDGSKSQLARVVHTFAQAGDVLVRLTVSDLGGRTSDIDHVVHVAAAGATLPAAGGPRSHVVVALIDTGINPYHQAFRVERGPPASFLDGYPANATPLALTLHGDWQAARDADAAAWKSVQKGQLYYIPGTRIVGAMSFGDDTFGNAAANTNPILDDDGHGSCTSTRVALSGPDVDIVMLEAGPSSLDAAMTWAAQQSWIDIVSISIGPLLNAPLQWPSETGDANPSKAAWDAGKLIFAAAGNDPTLSTTSYISGPSWVISVGAALPQDMGEPGTASKAMDIVSDYRPLCGDRDTMDGVHEHSGTSFSTPTAAGTVAQALYVLRVRQGQLKGISSGALVADGPGLLSGGLTNAELRDAMNGLAHYWEPAISGNLTVPVAPAAPWLQMGWGYLGPEDSSPLANVIVGGTVPAKPAEAQSYMAAMMSSRQTMWG